MADPQFHLSTGVFVQNSVDNFVHQIGWNCGSGARPDSTIVGWHSQLEYSYKTGAGGGDPILSEWFLQWTAADGGPILRPIGCAVDWTAEQANWVLQGHGSWLSTSGAQRMTLGEDGLLSLLANGNNAFFYKSGNNTPILGADKVATSGVEVLRIDAGDRIIVDANQNYVAMRIMAPATQFYPGGTDRGYVDSTAWQFRHQVRIGYVSAEFGALTLSGDVNDWAPQPGGNATAYAVCNVVVFSGGATPRNITGLTGGANGRPLWLLNIDSVPMTLKHESASSSAANRFSCPGGLDRVIVAGEMIHMMYINDGTNSRWRIVAAA